MELENEDWIEIWEYLQDEKKEFSPAAIDAMREAMKRKPGVCARYYGYTPAHICDEEKCPMREGCEVYLEQHVG